MVKKIDKSGRKYGLWTVIKRSERSYRYWWCTCQCGTYKEVLSGLLTLGKSKSCGCSVSNLEKKLKLFHSKYIIKQNGCWEWKGQMDKGGYGRFRGTAKSRKVSLAHRWSYEIFKGHIPKGMCVCHNCPGIDNRSCVNPDHLWLGTHLENNRDKGNKGTQCKGETNGLHKLTEKQMLEICDKYLEGKYGPELAKEYGVSSGLIYHITTGLNWKHIVGKEKLEKMRNMNRHYSHKLTDKDILDIRKRHSNGEKVSDLAKEYNLATTMVSRIKNMKAWKHL